MSVPVFKCTVPGSCPIEEQKEFGKGGGRKRRKRERKNKGGGQERKQEIKERFLRCGRGRGIECTERKNSMRASSKTWKSGETGLLNLKK